MTSCFESDIHSNLFDYLLTSYQQLTNAFCEPASSPKVVIWVEARSEFKIVGRFQIFAAHYSTHPVQLRQYTDCCLNADLSIYSCSEVPCRALLLALLIHHHRLTLFICHNKHLYSFRSHPQPLAHSFPSPTQSTKHPRHGHSTRNCSFRAYRQAMTSLHTCV